MPKQLMSRIRVVGHPYGPLGTSRVARCTFQSLKTVGAAPELIDVWDQPPIDTSVYARLSPFATRSWGDVNIFHLNGDEIERSLDHLGGLPSGGRNIVMPMWELPRYPDVWARQLNRFNEVWAASRYIAESITPAVSVPVVHVPVACEIALRGLRSRRYFGLPESAYTFLFFFDLRSYVERKNPYAVLDAFARLLELRPWVRTCLVIKVHGSANAPAEARELADRIKDLGSSAVMIDRLLEEDDVHNLVRVCDAFVSLHRAEGIGLGLAEAMWLAKPVIGTGYSGNIDFMTPDTSRLVPYGLVEVGKDTYPHWEAQVWADPDIDSAAAAMIDLLDDPVAGRRLGLSAARHMSKYFSYRAVGLRQLGAMNEKLVMPA